MIAGVHAEVARHLGFPVIAVASRSDTRSAARAAEWGCAALSYDRLPAGADLVIVATPPKRHYEDSVHALERGAAVIVEKPLVTTLNEADRLALVADRHGGRVLYAENLLFSPAVRRLVELVPDLGELTHLSLRTLQARPTWGGFLHPEWGGGVLFDLGVHPLALAVCIGRACGAGDVVQVQAELDAQDALVDVVAHVTLTFASGLTAAVEVSWDGPETPVWDVQVASDRAVLRLDLLPTTTLEHNGEPVPLPAPRGPVPLLDHLGYVEQLRLAAQSFHDGDESPCGVGFGRWILEIVCASYLSASRDSAPVSVPSGCDRSATPVELWLGGERPEFDAT